MSKPANSLPLLLALFAPALSSLSAQQTRTLPAAEATYDEPFTQIGYGGMRELKDGRVLVADPRDKIVQLVDFARNTAVGVGREGSGPGEYNLPLRVYDAAGDTSYLFDAGNQRYMVVSPDGKPVREFRIDLSGSSQSAGAAVARFALTIGRTSDSRGRIYFEGTSFPTPGESAPDTVPLLRWDPRSSSKADTLIWIKVTPPVVSMAGGQGNTRIAISPTSNPLSPRDEWSVFPDGRVAVVRADNYRVDWVMADGTRRSSAPIQFSRVRVTEADKREELAQRNRAMQGAIMTTVRSGPEGDSRQTRVGAPPIAQQDITNWPEFKPPFRSGMASVLARPNGELWVRRLEAAGAKGALYDVIDPQGRHVHSVRVPEGLNLVGFGNGTAYTVKLDEDDLMYLQRHRL